MSEFKVGDKVKTTVEDYDFPVGSVGEVTKVGPGGDVDIRFGGSHQTWYYFPSEVEKVEERKPLAVGDTVRVADGASTAGGGWVDHTIYGKVVTVSTTSYGGSEDDVSVTFDFAPYRQVIGAKFLTPVDAEQTIDLTDLDAEAVEKIKEFADSLRKQAPPTEDNKYIWITQEGDTELLAIRCSDGDYVCVPDCWDTVLYIHSSQITKWHPAEVK